jgi:hypothetical protein
MEEVMYTFAGYGLGACKEVESGLETKAALRDVVRMQEIGTVRFTDSSFSQRGLNRSIQRNQGPSPRSRNRQRRGPKHELEGTLLSPHSPNLVKNHFIFSFVCAYDFRVVFTNVHSAVCPDILVEMKKAACSILFDSPFLWLTHSPPSSYALAAVLHVH